MMLVVVLALGLVIALKFVAKAQETGGSPLVDIDVGVAPQAGAMQSDGTDSYLLSSAGGDIWAGADSFNYLYETLNGNGQIVARVSGVEGTNAFAKVGVMVRETLDPSSRNAMMLVTLNQGAFFQWRSVAGGSSDRTISNTNVVSPYWVKIVRNGEWIGGYSSPNGVDWTMVYWKIINGLNSQIYVGLAVSGGGSLTTAVFDQVSISPVNQAEVVNPLVGMGDGLMGSYYPNRHLYGVAVTNRVDAQMNFDLWKTLLESSANAGGLGNRSAALLGMSRLDEFGIRWTGEIQAQFTESYILHVTSDDGVRVWLNEQLVIDEWKPHAPKESLSSPLNLVAGQRYFLRVEYFQNHNDAIAKLEWSSLSTPQQLVPQSQMYSQPTDTDGNGLPDLWEQHYFGQIGVDPNADPDGDGFSNLQEYRRHSDPTNSLNWGLPNAWWHGDIGADMGESPVGDASYSNGVYTVKSSGGDIWLNADSFHYVYRPIGTNGQIVARILGTTGPDNWMKAGLMLRETLADDSRNAALFVTRSNGLDFQWRPTGGMGTLQTVSSNYPGTGYWLKLVRNGDWLGGYISTDGITWTLFDWEAISSLKPQVFVGLAVSSHGTSGFSTANFDQVNVGAANPLETMNPFEGNGDGLAGSYRSDSLLYLPGITNRCDAMLGFDWEHEDFAQMPPMINPNGYGVCWSGEIQPQFTEPYTFVFECHRDEWVRIWLNEQLIMAGWRAWHTEGRLVSAPINLTAGQRYLIRVEIYDNQGRGRARLKWSSPSRPEMPVPQSQLYSTPTDTDGNGLSDTWEQIYFGHIAVDPNADPDGDGLSNLQEYKYHTNPLKADTDSDGIPDAWEVAHGLDPQYAGDASLDYNNSGFSNLQDYQYGLDPFNTDANGDGLPDSFEVEYLNLTNAYPGLTNVVASLNGALATNWLGNWQVDGNDIFCLDRRGGLDFNLSFNKADKYVLNLLGTQNQNNPFETSFKLFLSVDGQTLGHFPLNAGYGTNGEVALVLPFLQAGQHTVHIFWDGHASFSSLRIHQVRLLGVAGVTNSAGVKNWAMKMIRDESGLDITNGVISSYTSPICLEGNDPYPLFMQATNNLTNSLTAVPTTDGRWYLNVPLKAGVLTPFQVSFQNQALNQSRNLRWQQVNLLAATNLVIRAGDALLLNAFPTSGASGTVRITIGNNTYTGTTSQPFQYRFLSNGLYAVSGTYTSAGGATQSGSITVDVVQQNLPNVQPAAWTGMQRPLLLPSLAPEATLQVDSRLNCSIANVNSNGVVQLALLTDDIAALSMVARIGTNGPVLDSTQVSGFDIWTGNQTYGRVVQTYSDGSQLIETLMVSSPVETNAVFVLKTIVGGVTFEDGTTTKTLTSTNFDALGQCPVRFIRPASVGTSACHQIQAFQGNYQIGYRR